MRIAKINIENFKCFKGRFSLALNEGANILVGNNEAGKSTILEAIHLVLTGILNGRHLRNELSQYLFNRRIEQEYILSLGSAEALPPPFILIEAFLDGELSPPLSELQGNGNAEKRDACGIAFRVEFDPQYQAEYDALVREHIVKTIPIEYYRISWTSFARHAVTPRSIPLKSALIDSANSRLQNGSDAYVSRIIRENMEDKERVGISQAHRQMKEAFMESDSVKAINQKINADDIFRQDFKVRYKV